MNWELTPEQLNAILQLTQWALDDQNAQVRDGDPRKLYGIQWRSVILQVASDFRHAAAAIRLTEHTDAPMLAIEMENFATVLSNFRNELETGN